jgi:uncharacterized protein (DUF1800 family)
MDRRDTLRVLGRRRRGSTRAPAAPTHLAVKRVDATTVTLSWKPGRGGAKAARFAVLRDRRRIGTTKGTTFTDRSITPSKTYRYTVEALSRSGRSSRASRAMRVSVPAATGGGAPAGGGAGSGAGSSPATVGAGSTNPAPQPGGNPSSPAPADPVTTPMVDRLFWRAGFGPSDADRQQWAGKSTADLVDWFLSTPNTLKPASKPPLTQNNGPIDPLVSDDELIMDWLYRMYRSTNPFVERFTFYLHRHWVTSRESGEIPSQWMLTYVDRLRSYADLGANPGATFRDLAVDMTTKDGAMSLFLDGTSNVRSHPNENYAREFMELFCLGVFDSQGNPNYTQTDVQELAKAFTGWRVDQQPANATYGQVSFIPSNFQTNPETLFAGTPWQATLNAAGSARAAQAVDAVLAHPSHAPFLVRKVWSEFIASAPPQSAVDDIASAYVNSGYQLKPLLQGILSHPLIFESLDEPNLVKPPVVYTVGVLRALDVPMKWFWMPEVMRNMQQTPYHPPNVAGWEGGLSWLNTNTVQARFDLLVRALFLKYSTAGSSYPGGAAIGDVPGETGQQAFDRAYSEVGSPWLSTQGRQQILAVANQPLAGGAPASVRRQQRQYSLRALMHGGPDGQVM